MKLAESTKCANWEPSPKRARELEAELSQASACIDDLQAENAKFRAELAKRRKDSSNGVRDRKVSVVCRSGNVAVRRVRGRETRAQRVAANRLHGKRHRHLARLRQGQTLNRQGQLNHLTFAGLTQGMLRKAAARADLVRPLRHGEKETVCTALPAQVPGAVPRERVDLGAPEDTMDHVLRRVKDIAVKP